MQGAAKGQVGPHGIPQGIQRIPLSHPMGGEIGMVHGSIQQDKPMARRRLAVGTVRPEFRQDPGVVSAGHDVGMVGQSSGRILRMASAVIPSFDPIVEGVHLDKRGRSGAGGIAQLTGTDVDHHPIVRVQVPAPQGHEGKPPRIGIRNLPHGVRVFKQRRRSTIEVHRPIHIVPVEGLLQGVIEGEGRHPSPLGPLELGSLTEHVAGLVDEDRNRKRLIGIRVDQAIVAGTSQFQIGVNRLIDLVGIVGRLIGPILQPEGNELGRDVVAQFRGTEGVIGAGVGRIATEVEHGRLEQRERRSSPWAVHEPVVQQAESGMADGGLLGQLALGLIGRDRQQRRVKGGGIPLEILPEEKEGIEVIVRRESIVTSHGKVEQVPGVDRGTGEVPANGLKQVLIPLPRHGGLDRHGPGRFRRTIRRRARLSPPGNRGKQQAGEGRKDKRTNGHKTR